MLEIGGNIPQKEPTSRSAIQISNHLSAYYFAH